MSRLRTLLLPVLLLTPLGCARQGALKVEEEATVTADATAESGPPVAPMPREVAARPEPRLPVAPPPHEPGERDLTNEDIGLDPKIEAALPEIERLDKQVIEAPPAVDAVVAPDAPPALDPPGEPPAKGLGAFPGRSGETKRRLIMEYGGNAESERAVALGLAWLAKQQKQHGGWEFESGQSKEETTAATGLALLAFLGAGETHRAGKYKDTVKRGAQWLLKNMAAGGPSAGKFAGAKTMYGQAIGTLALCEAYGITKDAALRPGAQAAVNFIQKGQAKDGSWGYAPAAATGDACILGWQFQALTAARRAGLVVDDKCVKAGLAFLDKVAGGKEKSAYGYTNSTGAFPGTALSAGGLWSRACLDGWGPDHPGMVEGVAGLKKNPPGRGAPNNLYYHYYAAQVMRAADGPDWAEWYLGPKDAGGTRKGGLRDWLTAAQVREEGNDAGSWKPENGWFGQGCGRLGTTAVCVLLLETPYRTMPLPPKKGADPMK